MASSPLTRILVINPNSSESITESLRSILEPIKPIGSELEYMTGPPDCPSSINDAPTSILSAHFCFLSLQEHLSSSPKVNAILVCCFSDHPLVSMVRHQFARIPCMHILESSISVALSTSSKPFAIITTGSDMVNDINRGIVAFMGGMSSKYAGCVATGLGVLELGDSNCQDKVQSVIRAKVHDLARNNDLGAVILGCAGMAGKESFIKDCLIEVIGPNSTAIIDGAKAGIHLLAGLQRCNF